MQIVQQPTAVEWPACIMNEYYCYCYYLARCDGCWLQYWCLAPVAHHHSHSRLVVQHSGQRFIGDLLHCLACSLWGWFLFVSRLVLKWILWAALPESSGVGDPEIHIASVWINCDRFQYKSKIDFKETICAQFNIENNNIYGKCGGSTRHLDMVRICHKKRSSHAKQPWISQLKFWSLIWI